MLERRFHFRQRSAGCYVNPGRPEKTAREPVSGLWGGARRRVEQRRASGVISRSAARTAVLTGGCQVSGVFSIVPALPNSKPAQRPPAPGVQRRLPARSSALHQAAQSGQPIVTILPKQAQLITF